MQFLLALLLASSLSPITPGNSARSPEWVQPGSGSRSPFINVRAAPYFAVGDGVADDSTAIANALAAAGYGPNNVIALPCAGSYKTTAYGTLACGLYYLPPDSGSVLRSIPSKLADPLSIKDFGAKGDGIVDDSAALTNALAAASGTQIVSLPCPGSYKTTAYGTLACGDYYPPLGSTGAFPRALPSKLLDLVSVKDFGAKGDNSTDDTTAIQNAFNGTPTQGLSFPCGTYLISAPIQINDTFFGQSFVGTNMKCVTIKASGAMAAMFQFKDLTANGGFEFREMALDGNSLAQKGIVSTQIRYTKVERVTIQRTTVAAIDFAEGWDQIVSNSFIQNNTGDGIRLGTNANGVNVEKTVISQNSGWGILITTGSGANIIGNDMSANESGGIYMVRGSGTAGAGTINIIGNYFEGNATHYTTATLANTNATLAGVSAADVAIANTNVGHVIAGVGIPAGTTISSASGTSIVMSAPATSSVTETVYIVVGVTYSAIPIKADILLNGSATQTTLDQSFPISNANIEWNTTTSFGATALLAHTNSAISSLVLNGNTHTTAYSLSTVIQQPWISVLNSGGLTALTATGNTGFSGRNGNGPHFHDRVSLTGSSGTVVIDTALAEEFIIAPTTNVAIAVSAPSNVFWTTSRPQYQYLRIRVRNALGGGTPLGAFTWNAAYKMAAWTPPADGFSCTIDFSWDLASNAWVEVSRSTATIPN